MAAWKPKASAEKKTSADFFPGVLQALLMSWPQTHSSPPSRIDTSFQHEHTSTLIVWVGDRNGRPTCTTTQATTQRRDWWVP